MAGAVVAALFAIIAYFLNRLIEQNDCFQRETKSTMATLQSEVRDLKKDSTSTNNLAVKINREVSSVPSGERRTRGQTPFDQETKTQILQINEKVTKLQATIDNEILPANKVNNGKIIWITDNLEAQDLKMQGLYKVMKAVVKDQRKR